LPAALWWIRRDLRLDGNSVLSYAHSAGYPVIPVFILDPHILSLASMYILHQDRRVVIPQRPKETVLKKMGEKITQADRAILMYRT
jgi:hypothetical protein